MSRRALALLTAALVAAGSQALAAPSGNPNVPEPARAVNIDRYLGLYYEIARYENIFERGCEGVTAEYSRLPGGLIQIQNICRVGAPDGRIKVAKGRAKITEGSRNAKFKVSFLGPLFVGDYWILDHGDDYGWVIVSDRSGKFLWILSREANPPPVRVAALVARCKAMGFNTDMLRFTRQPPR